MLKTDQERREEWINADSQDVTDDSDAPHVRGPAHRFIVDHFWGHKLRGPVHHLERSLRIWNRKTHGSTTAYRHAYSIYLIIIMTTIIIHWTYGAFQNTKGHLTMKEIEVKNEFIS